MFFQYMIDDQSNQNCSMQMYYPQIMRTFNVRGNGECHIMNHSTNLKSQTSYDMQRIPAAIKASIIKMI